MLGSRDCRLLTILGSGGIGKTRLAIGIGYDQLGKFPGGVWFVDLTRVTRPEELATAIWSTTEARAGLEPPSQPLDGWLRRRPQTLIILDTFEHILAASTSLAKLLDTSGSLTFLVTSREPLRLMREHHLVVRSLATPDLRANIPSAELRDVPSVAFFLSRARAINLDFAMSDADLMCVAELCGRLQGVPLSLELAATQANMLNPAEMLAGVDGLRERVTFRFGDAPERHGSLDASLDWSYALLSDSQREGFSRLAVFRSGFTLEASSYVLEAIGHAPDIVSALQDKGLAEAANPGGIEPRYRLVETVRRFALEKLIASGYLEEVRALHAGYYRGLAQKRGAGIATVGFFVRGFPAGGKWQTTDPGSLSWAQELNREHANFDAALQWFVESGEFGLGLALADDLRWYWWTAGYLREGVDWLKLTLSGDRNATPIVRGRALLGLASLLGHLGQSEEARLALDEAIAIGRRESDSVLLARALVELSWVAMSGGRLGQARTALEEAAVAWKAVGDSWGAAATDCYVAALELAHGRADRALVNAERAKRAFNVSGDFRSCTTALMLAAQAQVARRESAQAALDQAHRSLLECVPIVRMQAERHLSAMFLELAAWTISLRGNSTEAAQLLGAATSARGAEFSRMAREETVYSGLNAALAANLVPDELDRLGLEGRKLSIEAAIGRCETALRSRGSIVVTRSAVAKSSGAALSRREQEVLRLVAEGLSNKEIARRLIVSESTVKFHVTSILQKLSVATRTEAVSTAMRRGDI